MRIGYAGRTLTMAMAAVAVLGPELGRIVAPPPGVKPWTYSGGTGRWRASRPGRPRPHILDDGSVRVRGIKPKGLQALKFKPGCNTPGSKYENGGRHV